MANDTSASCSSRDSSQDSEDDWKSPLAQDHSSNLLNRCSECYAHAQFVLALSDRAGTRAVYARHSNQQCEYGQEEHRSRIEPRTFHRFVQTLIECLHIVDGHTPLQTDDGLPAPCQVISRITAPARHK